LQNLRIPASKLLGTQFNGIYRDRPVSNFAYHQIVGAAFQISKDNPQLECGEKKTIETCLATALRNQGCVKTHTCGMRCEHNNIHTRGKKS